WLAFFAAAVLVLQYSFARPSGRSRATPLDDIAVTDGGFRRLMRRLTDNPRFSRMIGFIFRFQSFFGLIIVLLLAIAASPIRNDANIFLSQRNLSNVTRDVAET